MLFGATANCTWLPCTLCQRPWRHFVPPTDSLLGHSLSEIVFTGRAFKVWNLIITHFFNSLGRAIVCQECVYGYLLSKPAFLIYPEIYLRRSVNLSKSPTLEPHCWGLNISPLKIELQKWWREGHDHMVLTSTSMLRDLGKSFLYLCRRWEQFLSSSSSIPSYSRILSRLRVCSFLEALPHSSSLIFFLFWVCVMPSSCWSFARSWVAFCIFSVCK